MFAIGRPDGTAPVREGLARGWKLQLYRPGLALLGPSRACVARSQAASTAWAKVGAVADAANVGGVVSACAAAAPTRAHHSTQPAEEVSATPGEKKTHGIPD